MLASALGWASEVAVRFDPASPDVGPFPTDFLTVADAAQATGKRINLSLPDCAAQPSSCQELALLNQLDGFSVHPRIRVRFSGAIDPETVRAGVFLLRLDAGPAPVTRINQVIYDPATNTAYAEPDQVLEPQARYALIVTGAVRDRSGDSVEPDPAFLACLNSGVGYCGMLSRALGAMRTSLPPRARTGTQPAVAASVFTTLSARTWLERARERIQNSTIDLQRTTPRAAVDVADIALFRLRLQTRLNPPEFSDFTVPFPAVLLAGVGKVAFGSYRSPSFLDAQQRIPQAPTGAEVALPDATTEVQFHALLPSAPKPAAGFPVIIFGHGLHDSQYGAPTLVASTFARAGFATIAVNAVGHGSGPQSRVVLNLINGSTVEVPSGGRSIDLNGDGSIESAEGCLIAAPIPLGLRDCLRQTVLDLAQLIRAIRVGMDLDGDGTIDLDRSRIFYAGQSLGALYGTVLAAVEPEIRAATLNVGGGSAVDISRWSPEFRSTPREYLRTRMPPLLNRSGDFDENYVLRNQPAKVNDVPGAIEIQNLLDFVEWFQMAGDPLAYAGQLRSPVLWQFARGDRTVPNPQTSALIRAAGNLGNAQLYRHDLAQATARELAGNPHAYLVNITSPAAIAIALAAQSQIAGFFESGGTVIPDANSSTLRILFGRNLFETPQALPEDLGF